VGGTTNRRRPMPAAQRRRAPPSARRQAAIGDDRTLAAWRLRPGVVRSLGLSAKPSTSEQSTPTTPCEI
jgi:hypothetical protein